MCFIDQTWLLAGWRFWKENLKSDIIKQHQFILNDPKNFNNIKNFV